MRHSFSNVQIAANRLAEIQSFIATGWSSLVSGMVNFVMILVVMMEACQPIYYKVMKTNLLSLIMLLSSFSLSHQMNAQAPPLATAETFAVFTAAGAIDNTGPTVVTGDLGTNVGAFNGFPPGIVVGDIHNADPVSAVAATDVLAAYGHFATVTCGSTIGTTLGGGQMLTPGVYCLGAASTLNGNLTLDAQGDPNAIFIFKINGAFSTGVMANIILANSASICNIYWQVGGQFTLGDNSNFYGTVITDGAISTLNNAHLEGRILSAAGAISLNNSVINNVCSAAMPDCKIIAYSGTETTGNQAYTERLGMAFTVNSPITISELGAYDSNEDGLQSTIQVGIIRSDGVVMVGPVSLSGTNDPLVNGHRMQTISSVILQPGSYVIVAVGYGSTEMNGNTTQGDLPIITNDGGGLLTFNGASFGGSGFGLPTTAEALSSTSYHAGTFRFSNQPACPANVVVTTSTGANTDQLAGDCVAWVRGINVENSSANCPNTSISYEITGATNTSGNGDASGTYFYTGVSTVTYIFTDQSNQANTASCSFTVTVEDNENPNIICPANIVVELNPLQCDSIVVFDATPTDNCPGATYEVSTSLESGDPFPIGENIVVYQATDVSGNTATCSFKVTIIDYFNSSLGCINRNVSLDQNCQAVVDPFMVLTGYLDINGDTLLGCLDSFMVNIKNPLGVNIGNTVDGDYLGKTLDYTISNPSHGFYCWGTIKIEDKLRPYVVCENDTISCVEPRSNIKKPKLFDNCDGGQLITLYDFEDTLQCNLKFLSKITRIYTAKDKYGNQGDTCTQIIFVERTDLSTIKFPDHFTGSKALECNKFAVDANGRPLVSVTGVPKLKNINIYPFNQSMICNGFVIYTDKETFTTSCKRIINRTWEVGEWWCDKTIIQTWVQVIEIKDKEAPVIGNLADMTVSTGSNSCTATFMLPKANVTDNCNTWSVRISTGLDTLRTNGGMTTLPVGEHTITYFATDLCSNQGTKTMLITVEDRAEPIAICEARAVVSLKEDGTAWLYAESVDDGSFDECGPVDLEIRRVTSDCDTLSLEWSNAVGFCCADAGEKNIMVELQVTDHGKRTNRCMMLVEVQDKRIPSMTCPHNITVDCSTAFDTTDLGATFDNPEIFGGGCADLDDVTETFSDLLNDCRIGDLHRKFILEHNGKVVDSCSQTITFAPERPFNANMIDWPRDTSFVNSLCTPFDLDPENLPEGYGIPQLNEEGVCDLVAFSYDQDVYSFTSNNACYKIVRHWTVINWCYYVNGKLWQDTFDQVIVIMNTEGPNITSPTTRREVCSYNADCTPAAIKLTAAADDMCTPQSELKWRWTITFEDGKKRYGTGNDASGIYAFGSHRIDFEVEDKCGNISYTGYQFDVKSCKPPTAYCKHGLSTSLVGMDTNGDNQLDAEMAMVTPEMFDNGSEQGCGNSIVLSFSEDVEDDSLWLSCEHLSAPKRVDLWVTDENGNQKFCTTYIIVKDSNDVNICAPGIIESNLNGRIHTSDDRGISDVSVKLESTEERIDITEAAGEYNFGLLPKGVQYQVRPEKSDNPLNGVSTLDLVLIQRHILGISKLDDPYKLIAADINQDGKVTASDLVILRKLILGVDGQMPNSQSWKFVWDGHLWADPTNPWATPIPETYDISFLLDDMEINFTGIKLGDLNGNVVANVNGTIVESRSSKVLSMLFSNNVVRSGDKIRIPIIAGTSTLIHGLQATIAFDGMFIKSMEGVALEGISEEHFYRRSDGSLNISWVSKGAANIKSGDVLMYIDAEVIIDGPLSKMIRIDENSGLSAEAYLGVEFEIADLEIRSEEDNAINQEFDLGMAKPNPWNESSFIAVNIPKDGIISLSVQDNAGKLVHARNIVLTAGKHQIELNRTMVGSTGSFIYAVTYNGETKYGKMIIID